MTIYRAINLSLLASLLVLGARPGWAQGEPLDLETCLSMAARMSPRLAEAQAAMEGMEARKAEATAGYLPKLKVEAYVAPAPEARGHPMCGQESVAVNIDGQASVLDFGSTCTREDDLSYLENWGVAMRTSVTAVVPVYTFGKLSSANRMADAGLRAARAQIDGARDQAALEVKRAFFGYQLARQILDVLKDGQGKLSKAREKIQKLLDQDSDEVSDNDLFKVQIFDAELASRVLEARRGLELARQGLKAAVGLPDEAPIAIAEVDLHELDGEFSAIRSYILTAQAKRPEMRMLAAGVEAQGENVSLKRSFFFPDLFLAGSFSYAYSSVADDQPSPFAQDVYNTYGFGIALGLKFDLDIGGSIARYRQAKADLRKMEATQHLADVGLSLEVQKHYGETKDAQKRIRIFKRAARTGRSWMMSNVMTYEMGVGEARELIDAIGGYFKARLSEIQALYDFNISLANLSRSVGREGLLRP